MPCSRSLPHYSTDTSWPFRNGLDRRGADVWIMPLTSTPIVCEQMALLLDADESRRADALRLPFQRRRFIATHSAARLVLDGYLGIGPNNIRIERAKFGKPFIAYPHCALRFNLAHSAELALLAVGWEREIGIDVEAPFAHDYPKLLDKALRAAPAREWLDWGTLGAGADARRRWVGLEAALKARGWGLAGSPGEQTDHASVAQWRLHEISVGHGYVAALCAHASVRSISVFAVTTDALLDLAEASADGRRLAPCPKNVSKHAQRSKYAKFGGAR